MFPSAIISVIAESLRQILFIVSFLMALVEVYIYMSYVVRVYSTLTVACLLLTSV